MLKNNKLVCIGLTCYTLIIFNILEEAHIPTQVAECSNEKLNSKYIDTFKNNEVNIVHINKVNNLIETKETENEKRELRQKEKQEEISVLVQEKADIKLNTTEDVIEESVEDINIIEPTEEVQESNTSSTYSFTNEEIQILQRITEAEVTGKSVEAKKNVASVIINRVKSDKFPNSIKSVVFQKNQFSPIKDGRYHSVNVTDKTVQAVDEVLKDGVTNSALFFCNYRDVKSLSTQKWFNKLTYLFKDDSGHSFYK